MRLAEVMGGIPCLCALPEGSDAIDIQGLAYDSRKVSEDYLFFAFSGAKTDGARFAAAAVEKGAYAVVSDRPSPGGFHGRWLQVAHGRHALALAARNFFHKPDEKLAITAVTGTNGKTTSTMVIDSILRAAGRKTALVGTIQYHLAGQVLPAVNTTPESLDLVSMMYELQGLGGTHFTLEASSHALDLGRIYGLSVHTAGFTNFTRDHLDYHGTMEAYLAAKQLLFTPRHGVAPNFAVLNTDDEFGSRLEIAPETRVYWYGVKEPGRDAPDAIHVYPSDIRSTFEGLQFQVNAGERRFEIESGLVGHINVSNILLACAAALSLGVEEEAIVKGLKNLRNVPGRFERVEEGQPFMVVVDYAHTDDALRNVISVARGMQPKRVITLFGCGGDRDRSKRPLMGLAAAEMSDFVVLTSDKPAE